MSGAKGMLWTIFVVGAWALLSSLATFSWDVFSMGSSDWKAVACAVIAGVGMFLTNYLAPWVTRYGVGSKEQ